MRITTLILVGLLGIANDGAAQLRATPVSLRPAVGSAVIVGRAVCGRSTWLLTKSGDLIRIARESRVPVIRRVRDLQPVDSFWGLACLDDGSFWTLATGHVLARFTADGEVVDRIAMVMPQVELFGVRDRLVFLGLPIVPNRPLLSTGSRNAPGTVRPWVGLVGRAGFGSSPPLSVNLVGCGLGFAAWMPCWFVDQTTVSISNGALSRDVGLQGLVQRGVDRAAPIRDVALVHDGSLWVLAASATAATSGPRVSQRLSRVSASGIKRQSVSLAPAVRLILWADATGCVLLTVNGDLLRISDEGGS